MKVSLFLTPTFHKWATFFWGVVGTIGCVLIAHDPFQFVVLFWSLYAIVIGHWGAWQAARAEKKIDEKT